MYNATTQASFLLCLAFAQCMSDKVREATTPAVDLIASDFYLHEDSMSGFALTADGELCWVFSLVKGRGDAILTHAIYRGAVRLDCFDGYLPTMYAKHGFVVEKGGQRR